MQVQELIKKYEGFSSKPYYCPAGILTIGYGHTGKDVILGMHIDENQAGLLLNNDIAIARNKVKKLIKVPLTDNQECAIIDFVFNLGAGRLQASTLRTKLNRGEYTEASFELLKWVYARGQVLKGLVKRRQEEFEIFNNR